MVIPRETISVLHNRQYIVRVRDMNRFRSLPNASDASSRRQLATVSTSEDVITLDISELSHAMRGRQLQMGRRNASSHGANYDGSASMWMNAAPGDMVKFSSEPGCENASSLPRRFGGVLDADMSTTIRLLIPPDTYYMCYAFGPFPYDEEAERVQRGLAGGTRRLSESNGASSANWIGYANACVIDSNMFLESGHTVESCKELCEATDGCVAIEFGNNDGNYNSEYYTYSTSAAACASF